MDLTLINLIQPWAIFILTLSGFYLIFRQAMVNLKGPIAQFCDTLNSNVTKRGISIMAKQGSDTRSVNRAREGMVKDVIDTQLGPLKAVAGLLGIDIDGYITDYGAENTLQALTGLLDLAKRAGINPEQIFQEWQKTQGQVSLPSESSSEKRKFEMTY